MCNILSDLNTKKRKIKNAKRSHHIKILDEALCVSLCANALREGMNPSVPPLARFFSLGKVNSLEENSGF